METLHFTVDIDAPVDRVWNTMLDDASYRQWASTFFEGSFYTGGWDRGDEIRFLGPNENGVLGGLIGRIVENRPHDFVSIEYIGQVVDGRDDLTSDDAKAFAGLHENYTFHQHDGVTTLTIDLDSDEKYAAMFQEEWPKSLAVVKRLAEG